MDRFNGLIDSFDGSFYWLDDLGGRSEMAILDIND
jgi:hypothetical protein